MDEPAGHLVIRAQRGEARAFAELILRHERLALAIAYAITGDFDAAGDVTQDAFIRVWRCLPQLREPQRFPAWLAEIVRTTACVRHRRKRCVTESESAAAQHAAPGCDPADAAGDGEMRDCVAAALGELDEVSRTAVVLRYYEGLTSPQIGDLLGLSPAAVDMRLMRSRQELRRLLAED